MAVGAITAKQIYNAVLFGYNGDDTTEINDYIKTLSWSTGTQSENIKTINPDGTPIGNNIVVNDPSVSLTMSAGAWQNFYSILNDRATQFSLLITQYTIGDIGGATQAILFNNMRQNTHGGSSDAGRPDNTITSTYVCTSVVYLPVSG